MRHFFILIVSVLVLLAGCTNKSQPTLDWETYKLEKVQEVGDSIINFSFDARCELPVNYMPSSTTRAIRDQLVTVLLGAPYVEYSNGKLLRKYCDVLKDESEMLMKEYENEGVNIESLAYEEIIRGKVIWSSDSILSYSKELYVFTGGAHGLTNTTQMVFDLRNGELINESDIFYAESMDALTNLLIKKANKMRDGDRLPKRSSEFIFNEPYPNGNFIVDYKGIEYMYNPYEIAPYVYGQVRIPLSIEEVLPMLKPESVVYKFFTGQNT